jgi:3-phenylpropionate/trans-cinnamate dioxygenase ferredoxin component
MAKLLKMAKTKDVPPSQAAAFTIEGQKIAVFNVEGTYYAIGGTCTHRGGPLSEGDVQGTRVTCPWHGFRPENRGCFGAASAEWRSKLQSRGRRR